MFKIGPSYDCCIQNLKLGAADIVWTCEIKYLGVNCCSGKNVCVDLSGRMRKYYDAVNSIISHTKNVNDILKLNLLEIYTLPILKYACESLLLNHNTLDILNVCWYNVFRSLQYQMGVCKNGSILLWSPGFHPYSSFRKIEVHCEIIELWQHCCVDLLQTAFTFQWTKDS